MTKQFLCTAEMISEWEKNFLRDGSTGISTSEQLTLAFAIGRWGSELTEGWTSDPLKAWEHWLSDEQRKAVIEFRRLQDRAIKIVRARSEGAQ